MYELKLGQLESTGLDEDAIRDIENLHQKEIRCLGEIHHPGIVKILDRGEYQPAQGEIVRQLSKIRELHFFVMEFVDGVSIADYFNAPEVTKAQVISVLNKACDALIYLHDVKQYLHADIRAANILIRKDTVDPVIIDFALYKNFNFSEANANDITKLLGDWDLFPKDIGTEDPLKTFKETKGTREN